MKIPPTVSPTTWKLAPQAVRGVWEKTGNGINPPSVVRSSQKQDAFCLPKTLCPVKASKTTEAGGETTAAL